MSKLLINNECDDKMISIKEKEYHTQQMECEKEGVKESVFGKGSVTDLQNHPKNYYSANQQMYASQIALLKTNIEGQSRNKDFVENDFDIDNIFDEVSVNEKAQNLNAKLSGTSRYTLECNEHNS